MTLDVDQTDFSMFPKTWNSSSTIQESVAATTAKTYTEATAPRAVRFNAAGTFEWTDFDDTTHSITTLAGEVLDIMPKTVTATTDIAWLGLW